MDCQCVWLVFMWVYFTCKQTKLYFSIKLQSNMNYLVSSQNNFFQIRYKNTPKIHIQWLRVFLVKSYSKIDNIYRFIKNDQYLTLDISFQTCLADKLNKCSWYWKCEMIINETESPHFFQQNGHIVSVPRRVRKKVNVGVYSLARKEHCLARPLHVTSGETRTIHSFLNSLGSIAFDYYSL